MRGPLPLHSLRECCARGPNPACVLRTPLHILGSRTLLRMRRVLITGFEPFGGEPINPSWLAASRLHGEVIGGCEVIARELPCVFGDAIEKLVDEIRGFDPILVIATGQAGGRDAISIERVAINVDDARIPDNDGKQPIDEPILHGAPAAYFSTLPIKKIVQALHDERVRAEVSQTAGTFVCNHVFYGLMNAVSTRQLRAGFVHVPYLPEQAARLAQHGRVPPAMSLDELVRALRTIVRVSLEASADDKHAFGATH